MAILDTRIQALPLKLSSAASADEILVDHNGTDATVTNTVGTLTVKNTHADKDIIIAVNDGGVDTEVLRVVAATSRIGINQPTPDTEMHIKTIGTVGGMRVIDSTDTVIAKFFVVTSQAQIGTQTAHPCALVSGNIARLTINTNGSVRIPDAYTRVIGGTNVDLYIDNTGLIGPAPSSGRYKENVAAVDPADTEWILNIPVKTFNFIGSAAEQIGIIAEEMEVINPAAVRYDTYRVGAGDVLSKIDRGQYEFVKDECEITKNTKVTENVKEKSIVNEVEVETIVQMDVKRIPEGIYKDQVIFALVNEVQKLIARVAVLEGLVS